eukprot:2136726-Pleurochrysis_carterae.AAC.1
MASTLMSSHAARLLEDRLPSSPWRTQHDCGVHSCPVCLPSASTICLMSLQMHLPSSHMLSHSITWPMTPCTSDQCVKHPYATARTHRHGASRAADLHGPDRPIQA